MMSMHGNIRELGGGGSQVPLPAMEMRKLLGLMSRWRIQCLWQDTSPLSSICM